MTTVINYFKQPSSSRFMMELGLGTTRTKFPGPPGKSVVNSRSITGPTPHAVGIIEKPKWKRPPEYLILERRKKEEMRDKSLARVDYIEKNDLFNNWVETTSKKIVNKTIQKRVDEMLQQQKYSLDERRERLRHLIMSEEEKYLVEMASQEETQLERQARMRERARFLKEKRERERSAFAEEKLEQRWRDQCEELRGMKFKRHLQEITKDRSEQLRLQSEREKIKKNEEALYAKMWEEDRLVKCKREDMELVLQIERNKEMVDILNVQSAAADQEKEALKELKKREAEFRREEAALRAVEELQLEEDRRRKQRRTKMILDYSLKLKMKNRAKEVQEELAFDMKLLEQMLAQNTNEKQENLERKKQRKEEVLLYRGYLQEQAEEEKRREKELDSVVSAEVEKQWSRRVDQWKKESEARKKLLKDVLETRKQQVQQKLSQIEEEKVQLEREHIQRLRNLREHEELEWKQEEERQQANKSYQKDLLQQIDYLEESKQFEKLQVRDELAMCKEAEAVHRRRVQEALNNPSPDKVHPTRIVLSGKSLL